eukprot:85146-Prymnesium_polylepis.2
MPWSGATWGRSRTVEDTHHNITANCVAPRCVSMANASGLGLVAAKALLPPFGWGDRVMSLYSYLTWLLAEPTCQSLLVFWPKTPRGVQQTVLMRDAHVLALFRLRSDRLFITRN